MNSQHESHIHLSLDINGEGLTSAGKEHLFKKLQAKDKNFSKLVKAIKDVQKSIEAAGLTIDQLITTTEEAFAKTVPPCPYCGESAFWNPDPKKMVQTCGWCDTEVSYEYLAHMKPGEKPLPRHQIEVPVRGVQKMNVYMEELSQGDLVVLVAEPDNPVDPYAVKVMTPANQALGYLPKDLAHRLDAEDWNAEIASILRHDGKASGIRLNLYPDKPDARLTGKLL